MTAAKKKPGPKKKTAKAAKKKPASSPSAAARKKSAKKPPWEKKNPKKTKSKLTEGQKEEAKSRAKKAGRPYPNLVDNMAVKKKATAKKKK